MVDAHGQLLGRRQAKTDSPCLSNADEVWEWCCQLQSFSAPALAIFYVGLESLSLL